MLRVAGPPPPGTAQHCSWAVLDYFPWKALGTQGRQTPSRWAGKAELPSAPFPPLSVLLPALSPGQRAARGGLGPDAVPRLQRGCPPVPGPRVSPALPLVWAVTQVLYVLK